MSSATSYGTAISSSHLEFMGLVSPPPPRRTDRACAAQSRILRMHRAQFRALSLSAIGDTRQSTDSERERAFQFRPQNGVPFSSPFSAFLKIGRISMRATRSRNLRPAPHSLKTHCKDTWGVPGKNSVAGY